MYTVKVRDHFMIAHSLPDDYFGPAKNLHGATYVVDAIFKTENLNDKNVVIDIGEAIKILKSVLNKLNYQNLDDRSQFSNVLTTTEFLAKYIHQEIKKEIDGALRLKVELHESHIASASYED